MQVARARAGNSTPKLVPVQGICDIAQKESKIKVPFETFHFLIMEKWEVGTFQDCVIRYTQSNFAHTQFTENTCISRISTCIKTYNNILHREDDAASQARAGECKDRHCRRDRFHWQRPEQKIVPGFSFAEILLHRSRGDVPARGTVHAHALFVRINTYQLPTFPLLRIMVCI